MEVKHLLDKLNITPNEVSYYEIAFTHPSVHGDEKVRGKDYERLEVIGDAAINFIVAELCYIYRSDFDQGMMSKLRSNLVQSKTLAKYAKKLNFDQYIKVGTSIKAQKTQLSNRIYEDVFEAFIGAIFIDKGYEFVREFLTNIFKDEVINFDIHMVNDYKSALQELMQAKTGEGVKYVTVEMEGPSHDPIFHVESRYGKDVLGVGKGKTKKAAEQEAARDALAKMVA